MHKQPIPDDSIDSYRFADQTPTLDRPPLHQNSTPQRRSPHFDRFHHDMNGRKVAQRGSRRGGALKLSEEDRMILYRALLLVWRRRVLRSAVSEARRLAAQTSQTCIHCVKKMSLID